MRRFAAIAGVVGVLLAVLPATAGADSPKVIGGGSSFVELEMDQWRADVSGRPYNLNIDYTAAGSTFGRKQFHDRQLDFGGTDIPYQPLSDGYDPSTGPPFVYVPVSAGGLGFMYNLIGNDGQRITNLKLDATQVCRLFSVEYIYWDDPGITALNPGVQLPHHYVRPVVRADGSGTSYVFSDYCIQTAPAVWSAFVANLSQRDVSNEFRAGQPTSQWPTTYGRATSANAADGVANVVGNDVTGADAITYNEAGFARVKNLPNASVANAAGVFKQPDAAAVTAALAYADPDPGNTGTFNLHKTYTTPDPDAYFPSTYSYVLAPTTIDPGKGAVLATFLQYAVTLGQRRAEPLGYARMSNVLVNLALDKIQQIPGAPPRPTDLGGAPPPVQRKTNLPPPKAAAGAAAAANAAAAAAAKARADAASNAAAASPDAAAAAAAAGTAAAAAAAAGDAGASPDATTATGDNEVASGPQQQTSATDSISDKDALLFFLIGFALIALGAGSGVAVGNSRTRGAT